MHLRIETKNMKAVQALKEALQQLQDLSEHVLQTFEVMFETTWELDNQKIQFN